MTTQQHDPAVHTFYGSDGLRLAYRELGTGRPLILLHGFTASSAQFLVHGQAEAIATRGHRVILPDLRGHGDSASPHEQASYPPDVLAEDGLALIERLGLSDYDLAGYSLGGQVVLRILARGARPARAVLGGQGLDVLRGQTERSGRYARVFAAMVHGEALEPGSPEAELAYWIGLGGGDPLALRLVYQTLVDTPADALRDIGTRTLVLIGEQDTSRADADALADALPHARFARIPGDHYSALAGPEFAATVTEFLADTEA